MLLHHDPGIALGRTRPTIRVHNHRSGVARAAVQSTPSAIKEGGGRGGAFALDRPFGLSHLRGGEEEVPARPSQAARMLGDSIV
jgi:hypothetical protein